MKKNIKRIYIVLLAIGFLISSCESLLEVDPLNNLAAEAVFGDITGAEAVLNSAYNRLATNGSLYGRDLTLLGDALADNIFTVTALSGQRWNTANLNNLGAHYNTWNGAYLVINDVNEILANAPSIAVAETELATLNSVLAQAYTIRALCYFDLARVYGYEPNKIPTSGEGAGFDYSAVIRLTPTGGLEDASSIVRSSIEDTYLQIESDLTSAIGLFETATTTTNYYMTLGTAYALRGRLYLYWERWQDAINDFNSAYANSSAVLTQDIVTAFTSVSNPEAFTQLYLNYTNQSLGVNNSTYSYTHPSGWNGVQTFGGQSMAVELYALFEEGDDRLGLTFNTQGYNWSNKYNQANGSYTDNPIIIRYADVLLMQAEAYAALGDYTNATALVRQLRLARNASDNVPTTVDIIDYIKDERRRELHFEGQRWFDLKRWGEGITKPAQVVGATFLPATDIRILAGIPSDEDLLFEELPQNPGY